MGIERIRRRNRLLIQNGQIPGANPIQQPTEEPRPKKRVVKGLAVITPCAHEGAVIEFCKSRHGAMGEGRHVRDCDIHERCTRAFVSHTTQWCGRCPDYVVDTSSTGSTSVEIPTQCEVKNLQITRLEHEVMVGPEHPTLNIDLHHTPVVTSDDTNSLPEEQRLAKRPKRGFVWMYGVTTVPERRTEHLPRTLKSLEGAGFPNPTLFIDGDWDYKSWHDEFTLDCVMRYPRLRVFGNWSLALAELYLRNPNASYYAIFQDDFIVSRNLRQYIEGIKFPDKGYLNLYTFPKNQKLSNGRIGFYPSNQRGKGAVGLIFNIEGVQLLLQHNHMIGRVRDITLGHKFVDGSVVESMRKAGWTEYVHNPSIIQHLGFKSSTGNPKQPQAVSFKGEDFDLLSLIRKS